jgi:hypothetical protein
MANEFLHQWHADEGTKLHGIVMGAAASGIAFALQTRGDQVAYDIAIEYIEKHKETAFFSRGAAVDPLGRRRSLCQRAHLAFS